MNVDNIKLICKEALRCKTTDEFMEKDCYGTPCIKCPFWNVCNDEVSIEEIKKIAIEYLDKNHEEITHSQPWTKEIVFKIYCNDNLYELPLEILKQMRGHLDNIIDSKTPLE